MTTSWHAHIRDNLNKIQVNHIVISHNLWLMVTYHFIHSMLNAAHSHLLYEDNFLKVNQFYCVTLFLKKFKNTKRTEYQLFNTKLTTTLGSFNKTVNRVYVIKSQWIRLIQYYIFEDIFNLTKTFLTKKLLKKSKLNSFVFLSIKCLS